MSDLPTLEQLEQTRLFYTNLVPDPDASAEAYCDYSGPSLDHPFHTWAALVIQGECQWVIGGPLPPEPKQGEQLALQNTVGWLRQQGVKGGVIYSDSPLCFPAVDAFPYELQRVSGEHPRHFVSHLSANLMRKGYSPRYFAPLTPASLRLPKDAPQPYTLTVKSQKPRVFYALSTSEKSPQAAWGAVMVLPDGWTMESSGPLVKGNYELALRSVMNWVTEYTPNGASLVSATPEGFGVIATLPEPFSLEKIESRHKNRLLTSGAAKQARKLAQETRKAIQQSLMLGKVL